MRRIVLLPGLDGTGALFQRFQRMAPAGVHVDVVALAREPLGYTELAARLAPALRLDPDTILLAESFSGPLAILLAERHTIGSLVLCNTFVASPRPRILAALPLTRLFSIVPPAALLRRYLVGPGAPDDLVQQVRAAIASVPPPVLAARLANVLRVDVAQNLAGCDGPVVYLRGTDDRLVTEVSVRRLVAAASVPVSVLRIPGPHLLLQREPAAAWQAIEHAVLRGPAA